jgi:membrane protein
MLFAFYLMIPNTRVRMKPALVGAFVAAFAWEIGKWLFTWYVISTVPYAELYGSLAIIPLFLFWLYINWLIILFGLELAATVQHMPGRMLAEQEHSRHEGRVLCDPQVVLPLMTLVGQAFGEGKSRSVEDLARKLHLPVDVASQLCLKLEQNGLLNRVEAGRGGPTRFALGRPPERISVPRLLELGRSITAGPAAKTAKLPGGAFLEQLASAQLEVAEEATLATVLELDAPDAEAAAREILSHFRRNTAS